MIILAIMFLVFGAILVLGALSMFRTGTRVDRFTGVIWLGLSCAAFVQAWVCYTAGVAR